MSIQGISFFKIGGFSWLVQPGSSGVVLQISLFDIAPVQPEGSLGALPPQISISTFSAGCFKYVLLWGKWKIPIWLFSFSNGLVQPPTR